jgi:hypothetical protein
MTYGHDIDTAENYVSLITEANTRLVAEGPPGLALVDIFPVCPYSLS